MRDKSLACLLVEVTQVLTAALVFWLAVGALLDDELPVLGNELALHVTAQVEIAAVCDSLELAELARREERERVLDVGGTGRVVAELVLVMLAQAKHIACQAEVRVPLEAQVAPVLVPLARCIRMAEELDLHLLELARAERELLWRDFVAEALAHLGDAERDLHARGVHDVLEVDKNALRGFGPQECRTFLAAKRADVGLEHQV